MENIDLNSLVFKNAAGLIFAIVVMLALVGIALHHRAKTARAHADSLDSISGAATTLAVVAMMVMLMFGLFGTNGLFFKTPAGEYSTGVITQSEPASLKPAKSLRRFSHDQQPDMQPQATAKPTGNDGNVIVDAIESFLNGLTATKVVDWNDKNKP